MDPFNFVKAASEGSWMPILIFIAWLAISLFTGAKNKKKRERRRELELERREREGRAESSEAEKRKPGPIEEIRRRLETVFSEERHTYEESASAEDRERSPDTAEAQGDSYETMPHRVEDAEYSLDTTEAEEDSYETVPFSYEAEPPSRSAPVKTSKTAASPPEPEAPKPPSAPEPGAAYAYENDARREAAAPVAISLGSLDEARRGFLWSEILAPPKALRE